MIEDEDWSIPFNLQPYTKRLQTMIKIQHSAFLLPLEKMYRKEQKSGAV